MPHEVNKRKEWNNLSLTRCALGVDTEGDKTIVSVVGKGVNHHGKNHDDILARLLHREERNDVIRKMFPTQSLEQNPADAQLQSQTDQKATDEQQQLALDIVLGLEDPITVPDKTVDDTQDISSDVGDTVGKSHLGVKEIESHQRDEGIQRPNHTVLEQLYSRLAGFGFIYLHDNSF